MTIPPNFLHRESSHEQYRPAVDALASYVVFERGTTGSDTKLYRLSLATPLVAPTPFLSAGITNPPHIQTRPDVCWNTGRVVFNARLNDNDPNHVVTTDENGTAVHYVSHTDGMVYPTCGHGHGLVVVNKSTQRNSLIDPDNGNVLEANINGAGYSAGMPAVRSKTPHRIAFAGQPDPPGWNDTTEYTQAFNYIFVNSGMTPPFTSSPLEPDAPVDDYDGTFQGRAPAWSPDGRWVVFESNRKGDGTRSSCSTRRTPRRSRSSSPRGSTVPSTPSSSRAARS